MNLEELLLNKDLLGAGAAGGITSGLDFSWPKIIAWLIFGAVGFVAFTYGRKERSFRPLLTGIALMVYPYFFTSAFWLYLVGIGLCVLLYYWRD